MSAMRQGPPVYEPDEYGGSDVEEKDRRGPGFDDGAPDSITAPRILEDVSSGDEAYPEMLTQLITKRRLKDKFGEGVTITNELQGLSVDERTMFHQARQQKAKRLFKEIVDMCEQNIRAVVHELGNGRGMVRPMSNARMELAHMQLMMGKALAKLGTIYGTEGRVKVAHARFEPSIETFRHLRLPVCVDVLLCHCWCPTVHVPR